MLIAQGLAIGEVCRKISISALQAILRVITKANHMALNMIFYYCVTECAQWVGVFNIVTGKARPFWEKAESTR